MPNLHEYTEKRTTRGIPDLLAFLSNNGNVLPNDLLTKTKLEASLTELLNQILVPTLRVPRFPFQKNLNGINQTIGSADFFEAGIWDAGSENFQKFNTWFFSVSGTWAGTFSFEASLDNAVWFPVQGVLIGTSQGNLISTFTANGNYAVFAGFPFVRLRFSTYSSGTANITAALSTAKYDNAIHSFAGSGTFAVARTEITRYVDTSTNLGSNATFTGTSRDFSTLTRSKFIAQVIADQAGTLFLERANASGGPWFVARSQAVVANTPVELEMFICHPFARVRYLNGSTAQGSFNLVSLATMT